jgi:hypothetical protein
VTAPNFVFVALFVTTTVAPGMTPPAESTTVPEIVAVACAAAVVHDSETRKAARTTSLTLVVIKSSCRDRTRVIYAGIRKSSIRKRGGTVSEGGLVSGRRS